MYHNHITAAAMYISCMESKVGPKYRGSSEQPGTQCTSSLRWGPTSHTLLTTSCMYYTHNTCYLELDTEQGWDWQGPWAHGPTHDPFVSIETL